MQFDTKTRKHVASYEIQDWQPTEDGGPWEMVTFRMDVATVQRPDGRWIVFETCGDDGTEFFAAGEPDGYDSEAAALAAAAQYAAQSGN